MDQIVSAISPEDQREQGSAHQDEEDHGGRFQSRPTDLTENVDVQRAVGGRQERRSCRADAGRFCRGCVAGEDGAQHGDDEQHGRDEPADQLPGRPTRIPARTGSGRRGWAQERDRHRVGQIKRHQEQPGNHCPREQISYRDGLGGEYALLELGLLVGVGEHVAEQHEGDGGRDDLAQGSRGADGARSKGRVVAATEHGGQGHQAQGDHRGADDARAGGHEHADQNDRKGKAPRGIGQQSREAAQKILGNPRLFHHHAHEHEQRHRDEGGVGDDSEQASGEKSQVTAVEGAGCHPAQSEEQRYPCEGQRDRVARQQGRENRQEHDDRYEFDHRLSARCRNVKAG